MSLIDTLKRRAGGLAGDVRQSARRARLDGELRLLQRQRRAALERLGERAYELIRQERLSATDLGPEVANVEGKVMEIDAKTAETDALREADDRSAAGPAAPAAKRRHLAIRGLFKRS